jgi:hypothetical protein
MFKTLRSLSIKSKLTWIALSLLIIPWMGYQYVQEMRMFLLRGQQDAQLLAASGIATVLNDRSELFNPTTGVPQLLGKKNDLYAYELPSPVQLDGLVNDWQSIIMEGNDYTGSVQFSCEADDNPDDFSMMTCMFYLKSMTTQSFTATLIFCNWTTAMK